MTRLSRASGITPTSGGSTRSAPSPLWNTTRLWRMSALSSALKPWSDSVLSSASAALPL